MAQPPEKERIYMLLDLLATVEDAGCEIIAESRRLRRMLRRVAAQKGHSGGEESERVLAEVERRVVVLGGLAKARRDDLLLVWKAAREVEEGKVEEEGRRKRRTVAEGAAALWGWLWGWGLSAEEIEAWADSARWLTKAVDMHHIGNITAIAKSTPYRTPPTTRGGGC